MRPSGVSPGSKHGQPAPPYHRNAGGERTDVSLGGAVESGEGGGLARSSRRREDNTSLEILGQHAVGARVAVESRV